MKYQANLKKDNCKKIIVWKFFPWKVRDILSSMITQVLFLKISITIEQLEFQLQTISNSVILKWVF